MHISQAGELKLLKEVREKFSSADADILIGIGDDAAVIAPQKENLIVTTDMMNEGVHFDMSYSSFFHIGFKLISVNVSDIMAMGGKPRFLFLSISIKKDTDEKSFWKLYEGIAYAMDIYGVKLLGGDLCSSKNDMVLSATVLGTGSKIITRGNASVGDRIYVTASIGDSACGLEILKRLTDKSKEIIKNSTKIRDAEAPPILQFSDSPIHIDCNTAKPLIERHLMPLARDSSKIAGYASSMIDISDGLFIDLCRICDESNVGARVYLDKIPISNEMKKAAEIMGLDPIHLATSGGEDYELLLTAPPEVTVSTEQCTVSSEKKAPTAYSLLPTPRITCIGEIIEKDRVVVDKAGNQFPMTRQGYQHFKT